MTTPSRRHEHCYTPSCRLSSFRLEAADTGPSGQCAAAQASSLQGSPASSSAPLIGLWSTQDHQGVVAITRCGNWLCGRLVGVVLDHPTNTMPLDYRRRSQCGVDLITDAAEVRPGLWKGHILDPRNGDVYGAELRLYNTLASPCAAIWASRSSARPKPGPATTVRCHMVVGCRRNPPDPALLHGSCVPNRDNRRPIALYQRGNLPVRKLRSGNMAFNEIHEGFDRFSSGAVPRQVLRPHA